MSKARYYNFRDRCALNLEDCAQFFVRLCRLKKKAQKKNNFRNFLEKNWKFSDVEKL